VHGGGPGFRGGQRGIQVKGNQSKGKGLSSPQTVEQPRQVSAARPDGASLALSPVPGVPYGPSSIAPNGSG